MIYIDNQNIHDPSVNLAIEEFILRYLDQNETYLLFYINDPSIIIGKNQNTIEEINTDVVERENIYVIRRLSGGGAVYHDRGNLNFSFITKDDGDNFHNFKRFTDPVVSALRDMGVNAELSGRNDLMADGKKISGNAQFASKGRMFSHGTLMFDSNIEDVVRALNVKMEKIESKGIKSIRNRVANIKDYLDEPMTIEVFKEKILEGIYGGQEVQEYRLTEKDWKIINDISNKRYKNWDWNYGRSPSSNIQHSHRFPVGQIDVRLKVERGVIRSCKIYGDFFGVGEVSDIEERLTGVKYAKADIDKALNDIEVKHYFGDISKDDFIQLIY
ncbi:lipoate-protein ligase A [Scopulibacillus daqui]|uniref:lipoate--protein ligase n=1 Tax=Scopulibacillus daqui TaxID=1469162 RepID=A0ABS2PVV1_9BACL|nr:lipoate--protein ligase [Scopulibacillus daqui]MBM7643840.1 lipoate-protein ligase A [Scopulibacillus daqui]